MGGGGREEVGFLFSVCGTVLKVEKTPISQISSSIIGFHHTS